MKLALMLFLVAFVSYFIGTINFAKIISWNARRKDITKIGSKNPGTMNMLRSHGFGLALATFVCEIVKAGLTCFLFKLCCEQFGYPQYGDIVYFVAALFMVIGYDFPVWSKFKGGKGVAVFAGILLFSHLWYVAIGWFVLCFFFLLIVDIGSLASFIYTGGLTIAYTIFAWVKPSCPIVATVMTCILWFLYVLMLIKHHANIKRLLKGQENKVGLKEKLGKFFKKKDSSSEGEEENSEQSDLQEAEQEKKEDNKTSENTEEINS